MMHSMMALVAGAWALVLSPAVAGQHAVTDVVPTAAGKVEITFLGHGTLMLKVGTTVVHVDPWTKQGDYHLLPKADLVLVTHEHFDHFDSAAIALLRKPETQVVSPGSLASQIPGAVTMKNGDTLEVRGIHIEAVPAYNLVHMNPSGAPYHAKGVGNGYVLTIGGKRFYIAGDTENTPEMKALKNIDVAFLPMNLPYTMTPEMVADAAMAFKPHILYPYHTGETDTRIIVRLMANVKGVETRIRPMK